MSTITIRPLSELSRVLPVLASNLSMSRAHLVIDQLRSLIGSQRTDEILFLVREAGQPDAGDLRTDREAGVVIYHPRDADFATMLLAGWTAQSLDPEMPSKADAPDHDQSQGDKEKGSQSATGDPVGRAGKELASVMNPLLYERGVRFMQFATDIDSSSAVGATDPTAFQWQQSLGFRHIANLQYQSVAIDEAIRRIECDATKSRVLLRTSDQSNGFASLVERTYVETLDCPAMNQFRSAKETIAGYRQNDAYDSDLWFGAYHSHDGVDDVPNDPARDDSEDPIGCLIMGLHRTQNGEDGAQSSHGAPITELVYMGLLPTARGKGLGRDIIAEAIGISKKVGAERMILAVDETNGPACDLYQSVGTQTMMRESVWGKKVMAANEADFKS